MQYRGQWIGWQPQYSYPSSHHNYHSANNAACNYHHRSVATGYPDIQEIGNLDELKEKPAKPQPKSRRKNVTPASRAEKSRCAAKYRRDREAEELANLTELLPFDQETVKNLDKASILRLATCYLHMKQIIRQGPQALVEEEKNLDLPGKNEELNLPESLGLKESDLLLDALDGFLIFVTSTGRIIFTSETCEQHLGIAQHELIGHGVLEFIHNEDHQEVVKQFRDKSLQGTTPHPALPAPSDDPLSLDDIGEVANPDTFIQERNFYVRMKCHLPRPGTKTKQTGHLLTQWTGRIQLGQEKGKGDGYPVQGLLAVVRPLHSTPIIEIRLDGNMFMSHHDLAMKYTFCDPRVVNLAGYEPRELIGHTAYQFHNPLDAQKIQHCHSKLIQRGTSVSKYYRFLGKTGDWVWMKTRATIIYNSNSEPQYVVCFNYVYSDEEGKRYQMLEEEHNGHHQAEGVKAFTTFTELSSCKEGDQLSSCSSPSSGYDSDSPTCYTLSFPNWSDMPPCTETPPQDVTYNPNMSPPCVAPNCTPVNTLSPDCTQVSPVLHGEYNDGSGLNSPLSDCHSQGSLLNDLNNDDFDLQYKDLDNNNVCLGLNLTFEPSLDVDWLDKMATDLMEATGVPFIPTTRSAVFDHDYSVQPMDTQANLPDVSDVDIDMFESSLLDANLASNTFLNGNRSVEQNNDSALLQLLGSNGNFRPVQGTMTVSAFPKHLMSSIGPANGIKQQQDFAVKFAQNMVEQRMRQDMLSYLSEETDTPPAKTMSYARDHSYTTPGSMPVTSASRQKKCVPYATSQSNGRTSRRKSSASNSRHNSPPMTPTTSENKASTLLEKMLLTKEPLNPNKGSDKVFQAHKQHVTQGLSQLNIEETDGNLLKQLLTGEINDRQVHQYERNIIENRKREDGDSGHPSEDEDGDYSMMDLSCHKVLRQSPQRTLSLELFDAETAGDMSNLLGPVSPDMEMLMRSDLDDILREQMRQDDLWLQQYYKDL